MAKYNVSSSHPDGEVGEVVEVGVGAGSAVEASVSSAMPQSLQGCTLTLLNKTAIRLTAVAKAAELVPNAYANPMYTHNRPKEV